MIHSSILTVLTLADSFSSACLKSSFQACVSVPPPQICSKKPTIQTLSAICFLFLYYHNECCPLCFARLCGIKNYWSASEGTIKIVVLHQHVIKKSIVALKEKASEAVGVSVISAYHTSQKQDYLKRGEQSGPSLDVFFCLGLFLSLCWRQSLSALMQPEDPSRLHRTCTDDQWFDRADSMK